MCYARPSMKAKIVKRFEDQIQALDRELKLDLPKEIQRAREYGDLRENAEYHAAKERQRLVESQISLLQKRVSDLALINFDRLPVDKVAFGSVVELQEIGGGTVTYEVVMPEDADPSNGMISTASPIGQALVDKEVGDEVQVPTPNGQREFEVVRLATIHDQ
jgi:transcription elongation factor GreA